MNAKSQAYYSTVTNKVTVSISCPLPIEEPLLLAIRLRISVSDPVL